jgi:hypothetical protein
LARLKSLVLRIDGAGTRQYQFARYRAFVLELVGSIHTRRVGLAVDERGKVKVAREEERYESDEQGESIRYKRCAECDASTRVFAYAYQRAGSRACSVARLRLHKTSYGWEMPLHPDCRSSLTWFLLHRHTFFFRTYETEKPCRSLLERCYTAVLECRRWVGDWDGPKWMMRG